MVAINVIKVIFDRIITVIVTNELTVLGIDDIGFIVIRDIS